MLDFMIQSLSVGITLIGLMTPAVLLVMWLQYRDFGQPRIRLEDIMPELREIKASRSDKKIADMPYNNPSTINNGMQPSTINNGMQQCTYSIDKSQHCMDVFGTLPLNSSMNPFLTPQEPSHFAERELLMFSTMFLYLQYQKSIKK